MYWILFVWRGFKNAKFYKECRSSSVLLPPRNFQFLKATTKYRSLSWKSQGLKPIAFRSDAFSRALHKLHVFTSSFDWFIGLSMSFVIGQRGYFCVSLRYSIENRSKRDIGSSRYRIVLLSYVHVLTSTRHAIKDSLTNVYHLFDSSWTVSITNDTNNATAITGSIKLKRNRIILQLWGSFWFNNI